MRARTIVVTLLGAVLLPVGVATASGFSAFSSSNLGAGRAAVTGCNAVAQYVTTPFTISSAGTVTEAKLSVDVVSCAGVRLDVVLVNASPTGTAVGRGELVGTTTCTVDDETNANADVKVCTVPVPEAPGLDVVRSLHVLTTTS